MPNISWVPRINVTIPVDVTPTITSGSAYTSSNQVGGIMTLTDAIRQDKSTGFGQSELHSIKVVDTSSQSVIYNVWIFNKSPSVTSTDKTAFTFTSATTAKDELIGVAQIGSSYATGSGATMNLDGTNLSINCKVLSTFSQPTNLYAIAQVLGTPTYTSTSALKFIFSFYID